AELAAVGVADRAWVRRQVAAEKLGERPLADEADAGAVLLLGHGQARGAGALADLGLGQVAEREQHVRELLGRDRVQKIGLVLAGVAGLPELRSAFGLREARVVAGGEQLAAEPARVALHHAELDL